MRNGVCVITASAVVGGAPPTAVTMSVHDIAATAAALRVPLLPLGRRLTLGTRPVQITIIDGEGEGGAVQNAAVTN